MIMNTARILGTTLVAGCLATAGALYAQDKSKDKAVKSTVVTKVLLENDKVRVTETTFKPGDISFSERKARVSYPLKNGTLERTTKDGKKTSYERKAGEALWQAADNDVVRNVGKNEYVVVTFTPK
jgi:hypothetical protein